MKIFRIALMSTIAMAAAILAGEPAAAQSWGQRGFSEALRLETETGPVDYRVYLPESAAESSGLPLLLMLHGCTQDAADFAAGTRMNEHAEQERVIVAYPEQTAAEHPQRCWQWYLPEHQRRDGGEPARLATLARHLVAEYDADPARVYVSGISAGGAMAALLAANYTEIFAAVAVHSGIPVGAAADLTSGLAAMQGAGADSEALAAAAREMMGDGARPLPLIVLHGADDPVVTPTNAERLFQQWLSLAPEAGEAENESRSDGERPYERRVARWDGGRAEAWLIEGLGHAWSGGSESGTYTDPAGPSASAIMLRFLLEHGLHQ